MRRSFIADGEKETLSPRLLVTIVGLGVMLNPLNSSMIAMALITLKEEFSVTLSDTTWLISTYYLASAVMQPLAGKLGDLLGRRPLFLLGLALAGLSSLLAPLSTSFAQLLAFRTIQAVGSSMVYPSGLGMVRYLATEQQGKLLGMVSVFSSGSAAFGPTVGALLIDRWDWPAMFLINFPFILTALFLGWRFLPGAGKQEHRRPFSFDAVGAVLFALAVVGLLWVFLDLGHTLSYVVLVASLLLFALLTWWELHVKEPFIDLRLFLHDGALSMTYLVLFLFNLVTYTIFFAMPLVFLEMGYSLSVTGLFMLFMPGVNTLFSPIGGMRIDRKGYPYVLKVASLLLVVSTGLFYFWPFSAPIAGHLAALGLVGVSLGYFNVGLQTANFDLMPHEWVSSATGLFMTTRYIGTIISSAVLGLVFQEHLGMENIRLLFLLTFLFSCLIMPLTFWLVHLVNHRAPMKGMH